MLKLWNFNEFHISTSHSLQEPRKMTTQCRQKSSLGHIRPWFCLCWHTVALLRACQWALARLRLRPSQSPQMKCWPLLRAGVQVLRTNRCCLLAREPYSSTLDAQSKFPKYPKMLGFWAWNHIRSHWGPNAAWHVLAEAWFGWFRSGHGHHPGWVGWARRVLLDPFGMAQVFVFDPTKLDRWT